MIIALQIFGIILVITLSFAIGYSLYITEVFIKPINKNLEWLSYSGHEIQICDSTNTETQKLERLIDQLFVVNSGDQELDVIINQIKDDAISYLMKRDESFFFKYHYYRTLFYRISLTTLIKRADGRTSMAAAFFREKKGFDL